MAIYTQYAARTGKILTKITIPDYDQEGYDLHNSLLFNGELDGDRFYIVDGEPTTRPAMQVSVSASDIQANGIDSCVLSCIPDGAIVTVSGSNHYSNDVCNDGEIEFKSVVPGHYVVKIECFPYKDFTVSIDAD